MNTEPTSECFRLVFSPDPGLIGVVRGAVQMVAEQSQFTEAEVVNVSQAVEEALRLIVAEHQRERPEKTVQVSAEISSDRLEIVVENSALGGLLESSADIYLMMGGVDQVVEERTAAGGHRVTLVKHRAGRA
ncbi:MAG: ATP-binding protein [Acidobacteria bacterium]|nr:ATP-binding protein [Acidobacteriota bacterium]